MRTSQAIEVWKGMNGKQGGDPAKLAAALVRLSASLVFDEAIKLMAHQLGKMTIFWKEGIAGSPPAADISATTLWMLTPLPDCYLIGRRYC